jgi:hypothetical protein
LWSLILTLPFFSLDLHRNFVIDAPFDDIYMRDPSELSYRLKM